MDGVMSTLRIYLAGPDVFLPNAGSLAETKRKLCESYGFTGVSPVDNEIDLSLLSKREAALRISTANEEAIRGCQLLIANLTPFRGPSADVGTAYEMGFARALGLPIFGYTNCEGTLLQRVRRQPGAGVAPRSSDKFEDSYYMAIEDFDLTDNLMLVCAILGSRTEVVVNATPEEHRFTDLAGFEACLRLAARWQSSQRYSSLLKT
jgi:nucleoside 2-deoxyribosyltransferase